MNRVELAWKVGRPIVVPIIRAFVPLRVYGKERVPREGGVVMAFNHFSWVDPPVFGAASPRPVYFMAKVEAHRIPGVGQFMRVFGTFSVRRGESDREAVRIMREIVHRGDALGMFPEGTRQKREPGAVLPGAAMIAVQEGAPVVCGAIHGSQDWRLGNFHPVSIAFGEPFDVSQHPRNSKGYRAAALDIQRELRKLWEFLVTVHEQGRPRIATPPV